MMRLLRILVLAYLGLLVVIYFRQRSMLFLPSHNNSSTTELSPWSDGKNIIGDCREVSNPQTIWLMTHGNGGQAADRDYVLPRMSDHDSLYVLEYPGYGARQGSPSRESLNKAASEAYEFLRAQYPNTPICVLGESLGSGPACTLAREKTPPDKIILVVPFDTLASTASSHFPYLPVRLMLRDAWDNIASLKGYTGPVEIFGAKEDTVIPISHAENLAKQIPQAHFIVIDGGHNDWSASPLVKIER